jgi:hypothetical protein
METGRCMWLRLGCPCEMGQGRGQPVSDWKWAVHGADVGLPASRGKRLFAVIRIRLARLFSLTFGHQK